jgi:hypothetical protein
MPASFAQSRQKCQHGGDRAWCDRGAAGVAAAQQLGHDPRRLVAGAISQDAPGRGLLDASGALSDLEGRHETGMRWLARGKLERQGLAFFGRRGRKRVEKTLLYRLAQGGMPVERGERRRGQMTARGPATAARVEKRHPAPNHRRGDGGRMTLAKMLDRRADGGVLEADIDGAHQHQRTTPRQDALIEYAAEIVGRERRQHARRKTLEVGVATRPLLHTADFGRSVCHNRLWSRVNEQSRSMQLKLLVRLRPWWTRRPPCSTARETPAGCRAITRNVGAGHPMRR